MFNILSLIPSLTHANGSYYYYSLLNNEQKRIYGTILSGIKIRTKNIKMPIRPINEIAKIYNYALLDNPMLFYVSSSFRQSSDLYKKKCTILPEYIHTRSDTRAYTSSIKNYLREFDSVKDKNDIDKELYVHDYCLNNFSYDYSFDEYCHSIVGLAINKTAVCEGIAKFVKCAFDYLGVKSLVVSGKAKNPALDGRMEGHAWNIVRIDGKTYHLDVTFDMTIKDKILRYDYFNLSDAEIKKDHVIVDNVPTCTTIANDYYSLNSLFVNSLAELGNYFSKAMKQRKRNILVKIKGVPFSDDVANKVMNIAEQQYGKIGKSGTMIEMSYNSSQMVFEIILK